MGVDGVVPFAVEVVRLEGDGGEVGVGDLDALLVSLGVVGGLHSEPGRGGGRGDQLDDGARLVRGRPRQFIVMNENMRCSIRFHFEVPGG